MSKQAMKLISRFGMALFVVLGCSGAVRAQWTTLNNGFTTTTHLDTCLLLTNGDVMCHEYASPNWHRRRPDTTGSYLNGTWDNPPIAPMPQGKDGSSVLIGMTTVTCNPCVYGPTYFASQVLPNGKVVVIGGEYNAQDGNNAIDTNIGFLYDPATDSWSTQLTEPFGTGNIGDAVSVVVETGTMLLGDISNSNLASFDPATLTFTALNPSGKVIGDTNDEEGWTNLPNNRVLTVDANTQNSYEIYDVASNSWGNAGTTAGISLTDLGGPVAGGACNSHEVGPGVARADGTIIYFSGSTIGQNAVYNIGTDTWSHPANVDFPVISGAQYGAADAPASLLPDGHVLIMSSPVTCNQTSAGPPAKFSIFNAPSHFFEWDGSTLTQVGDSANASNFISYQGRMLLLPTGEVLFTAYDQSSNDAQQLYRNSNPQLSGVEPVITSFPPSTLGLGNTYSIAGNHFNGFSQGAFYGDDAQSSTNYPLVRITDSAGHVLYAKTHDHNHMGVEAVSDNATVTSTNFDVPTGLATGSGSLVVVTNGFPSAPYSINVEPASVIAFTGGSATSSDFSDAATVQAQLTSSGNPISGATVTFVLGSGAGTETCSATTDGAGTATCSITPNQAAGGYTLTATFGGDSSYAASSVSTAFTILHEETAIAFTGASATNADYDDAATVQAQLTTDGAPLANELVTISLGAGGGTETCSVPLTGAGGLATCSITPNQQAGIYTITATFGGDAFYAPSSVTASFTINKEEDTTKFTASSPTVIASGHSTTFSATLLEDGVTPIVGRTITITIGTQSCPAGPTDVTGTASCSILISTVLGPGTVTASFAGDAFYLPSSATEPVIVFAFLNSGSMIIGNLDGASVEFWGAQWAKSNSFSGGSAPNSFKGFANTAPQTCGGGWTSNPGNSSGPPSGPLPSYMGVLVSSTVVQSGSVISGNVPKIVVVQTKPGYGPDPGHAGTGTVVAVFCGH